VQVYDLILLEAFFEQNAPAGGRHLRDVTCGVHGEPTPRWRQVQRARLVGLGAPDEHGERHRFAIAEVPLAPDGSFQLLVPPRVSFDVQAVSGDGLAISSPERWLYTLPGEKHTLSIPRSLFSQTCEGCHGALNGQPTPAFGRPDVVSSASRTMAMWNASERRTVEALAATDREGWIAVGWAEDIAPLVTSRCSGCHTGGGGAPAPALDATATAVALAPYVGELAIRSPLAELLLATELDAHGPPPAHPTTELRPEELATVMRWLDLGAPPRRAVLP
jgi:mono/diheme cytochrome c family protein